MAMKVAIIPKYMTVKNKKRKNKTVQNSTKHLSLLYTGTYAETGGENANSNMGKTFFQGRCYKMRI